MDSEKYYKVMDHTQRNANASSLPIPLSPTQRFNSR